MKKLIYIALSVFVLSISTQVQAATSWFAESQNLVQQGNFVPRGILNVSHTFEDSKFGFYGFSMNSPKYGEVFGGPTYQIAEWLKAGIGGGVEKAPKAWRTNAFIFSAHEKHSLFLSYEHGGGGYFYVGKYNYLALDWFGMGAIAQRNNGIGPKIELSIPKTPMMLWLAPVFNPEDSWKFGALISLRATFK